MVGAPAKKIYMFTKAACIPAWQQSEITGPSFSEIYFPRCPNLEYIFQVFELSF